jgi:outer membrane murein-binding lipoprotein Lpp
VVPRAYLDQLERSNGLARAKVSAARDDLTRAEKLSGQQRRDVLKELATQLSADAQGAADPTKVRTLAAAVTDLANAEH